MISAASPADNSLSSHFDDAFAALCESADVGAYAGAYEPQFAAPEGPLVDVLQGTAWASEMASATISDADVAPQGRQAAQPVRAKLDNRGRRLTPSELEAREGIENTEEKTAYEALRRRKAWALRDVAAMLLRPDEGRGPSVCACGRAGHEVEEVDFHLNEQTGVAKTTGVFFCDSAWLCPVCAPRQAKERETRVAEVYDMVWSKKGTTPMMTVTVRHTRKMALLDVKRVVESAARAVRQGAPWKRIKEKYGVFGVLTAPEVTWSAEHGWHYHLHIGIPSMATEKQALELGEWFLERYMSYVRKKGFNVLRKAQDATVMQSREAAISYLAKGVTTSADAVWELVGGANKRGKSDAGLHPFDILERASSDAKMAALWLEYAAAIKGTRSCVITKALAENLGLNVEEEDIGDGSRVQENDAIVHVGSVPSDIWNRVMQKRLGNTALSMIEDLGVEGWPEVRAFIFKVAEVSYGKSSPVPVERQYSPTVDEVVREVLAEQYREGSKARAVKVVLDRHRGVSIAKGMRFVPPDLKSVLDKIAA